MLGPPIIGPGGGPPCMNGGGLGGIGIPGWCLGGIPIGPMPIGGIGPPMWCPIGPICPIIGPGPIGPGGIGGIPGPGIPNGGIGTGGIGGMLLLVLVVGKPLLLSSSSPSTYR